MYAKIVNNFWLLTIFAKKLHHRYSTGFLNKLWATCLRYIWWSIFMKIVDDLLFLQKSSIISVRLGSNYTCVICRKQNILYKKLKTLGPLFISGVQLPQGYRATVKRKFPFYHSVLTAIWEFTI